MDEFGQGEGPYTEAEMRGIQAWLDEDWEACDQPKPLRVALQRLLDTVNHINLTPRKR